MSWVQQDGADTILRIRVQPRAARDEIVGPLGHELKIRLQAPPADGKANKALLRFLSKRLGVPAFRVTLRSGATSRSKRVCVVGSSSQDVASRLQS
jgi:uncharacterized protein (TIGR00251 family)